MCKLQVYNSPTDFYEYNLNDKSHVTVGRYSGSDIRIQSTYASRSHCSLVILEKENIVDDFYWVVKDNGSSNGTWVNNNKIVIHTLKSADEITFCDNFNTPKIIYICEPTEVDAESRETGAYEYEAW